MTDCPHDIIHCVRIDTPDGQRASYWACVNCGHAFDPRNDSRERAMAEFVAAFDAWSKADARLVVSHGRLDEISRLRRTMDDARAALDARGLVMDGWSDRLTTAPNDVWQCTHCGWIGVRVTAPVPTHCPVCGTEWDATEDADG